MEIYRERRLATILAYITEKQKTEMMKRSEIFQKLFKWKDENFFKSCLLPPPMCE